MAGAAYLHNICGVAEYPGVTEHSSARENFGATKHSGMREHFGVGEHFGVRGNFDVREYLGRRGANQREESPTVKCFLTPRYAFSD